MTAPGLTLRGTGFFHAGSRRQLLHPHLPGCRPRARACRQLRALTVRWFTGWYGRRGGILKAVLGALLLVLVAFYLYFFRSTQRWTNFDPNYAARYTTPAEPVATGDRPAGGNVSTTEEAGAQAAQTCRRSQIVDATADLVDFNVNQNPWISSMLLYKLGLFGIPWERTPFFDNKTAFQRGVNQAVRRTAIELVDTLGRVRGPSGIHPDLQKARGNLQFDEDTWYDRKSVV